ncbi:hypothetical protein NHX12_011396 [Muraenolepis orangiensis]|uniref:Rab-GAP TBC domain-containing protein n=1 Tax=Muraenolepis orangiensis TaxID=630683 RepID=A0A9Q0I750_9TELE|nr:hypothetical protein NHX12_011396 [Muraenolepis orangiensis]
MLEPSRHTPVSQEDSCLSDPGPEAAVETDRFGFLLANGSTAGGPLLDVSSDRSVGPAPELVRQREAKWIYIISQWDHVLLKKNNKVKEQCQKGIPASLRAKCWPLLSGATEHMRGNKDLYLCLDSTAALQSWVDVIERDLDRQFPFHEMFVSKDGHGQRGLFRVLKAYTQYQPDEGYCQAQGPVAAVLLMNMPAEEAFWCLVQISEHYLPGYYSQLLEGVQFDAALLSWVLKRSCLPAHRHLQRYGVEPLMFATDWLMCLFTRHLPFNTLLRVWDLFFCHGVRVLFQVAVVLVRRVLGRAEQRQECAGQMETLERLRAVRDSPGQQDDGSFMAEVCSVPLSRSDLKRRTDKELEKWRQDRPSSTFDPRGRCHGYWTSREASREERDRKSWFKGNLSGPLVRSASALSLSPSLLHKRWRKQSDAVQVERHRSMGNRGVGRESWMEARALRVSGVEEEEEEYKAPGKLQSHVDTELTKPTGVKIGRELQENQSSPGNPPIGMGELKEQKGNRQLGNRTTEGRPEQRPTEDSQGGLVGVQGVSQHHSVIKEGAVGVGATQSQSQVPEEQELKGNSQSQVPEEQELKDNSQSQVAEEQELKDNSQSQVAEEQELKDNSQSRVPEEQELKDNSQSQVPEEQELKDNSQSQVPEEQELKDNSQSQVAEEQELKDNSQSQVPEEQELKDNSQSQVPEEQELKDNSQSQVPEEQELKDNSQSQVAEEQELKGNSQSHVPEEQELKDNSQSQVPEEQELKGNSQSQVAEEQELKGNSQSHVPEEQELKDNSQSQVPEEQDLKGNSQSQVPEEQELKDNSQSQVPEEQDLKGNSQSQVPEEQELKDNSQSQVPEEQQLKDNSQSQVPEEQELKDNSQSQVPEEQELKDNSQSQVPEEQQLKDNSQSQVAEEQELKDNSQSQVAEEQELKDNSQSQVAEEQELKDNSQSQVPEEQQLKDNNQSQVQRCKSKQKEEVAETHTVQTLYEIARLAAECRTTDADTDTQVVVEATEEQTDTTPEQETMTENGQPIAMHADTGTTESAVNKSTKESTTQQGPDMMIETEVSSQDNPTDPEEERTEARTTNLQEHTNMGTDTETDGDIVKSVIFLIEDLKNNLLPFEEVDVLMQKGVKQSEDRREGRDFVVSTEIPAETTVVTEASSDICDAATASRSDEACSAKEATGCAHTQAEETHEHTEEDKHTRTCNKTALIDKEFNPRAVPERKMCSSLAGDAEPLTTLEPAVQVSVSKVEEIIDPHKEALASAEVIFNPNTSDQNHTVLHHTQDAPLPTTTGLAGVPFYPDSTHAVGHQWSRPSGDFCKSSCSHGSRLARRLSQDIFTAPQASQVISNQNAGRPKSTQVPSQTGPDATPPGARSTQPPSQGPRGPTETTGGTGGRAREARSTTPEKSRSEAPKHPGLFSRLRGHPNHGKDTKVQTATTLQKIQIPKIFIQDLSDAVGEEQKEQSSRGRRRRRREMEKKEREEEKVSKRMELKKEGGKKGRKGLQLRKDERHEGKPAPSSIPETQERYSAPFTDSYF